MSIELLAKNYHLLLYEYLINETQLKEYDDYFSSSNLNYVKTSEACKDAYQMISPLNYFFIRSKLYIDNLIEYNKSILENINSDTDYEFRKRYIEDTLSAVITNSKYASNYMMLFGTNISPYYMAKNGSLVIGFRYDELLEMYVEDDEKADAWAENLEKQEDEIYELLPKIQHKIETITGVPVKIIQYNGISVHE